MAQIVKSTPGAIGYVDYADAKATGLSSAEVKNKAGNYVAPSTSAASVAAAGVTVAPNLTFHAVWGSGAGAYPITYQSWVLVYQEPAELERRGDAPGLHRLPDRRRPETLPSLGYAPLPANIDQMAKAQLSKIGSASSAPSPGAS